MIHSLGNSCVKYSKQPNNQPYELQHTTTSLSAIITGYQTHQWFNIGCRDWAPHLTSVYHMQREINLECQQRQEQSGVETSLGFKNTICGRFDPSASGKDSWIGETGRQDSSHQQSTPWAICPATEQDPWKCHWDWQNGQQVSKGMVIMQRFHINLYLTHTITPPQNTQQIEIIKTTSEMRKRRVLALVSQCNRAKKRKRLDPVVNNLRDRASMESFYMFVHERNCQKRLWDKFKSMLKSCGVDLPSYTEIKESTIATNYNDKINQMVKIHEYDSTHLTGAYVSLIERLKFAIGLTYDTPPSNLTVCLGGDGRSYSHKSHSVGFGFYLVQDTAATIVSIHNHSFHFIKRSSLTSQTQLNSTQHWLHDRAIFTLSLSLMVMRTMINCCMPVKRLMKSWSHY